MGWERWSPSQWCFCSSWSIPSLLSPIFLSVQPFNQYPLYIWAQTAIDFSPWVLGRHPDYWDLPLEFRPERWIEEGVLGKKPVPKTNTPPFIPFNYGPRTCLGMKMVNTIVFISFFVVSSALLRFASSSNARIIPLCYKAYLEVKMMASLLLQHFELELAPNQVVHYAPAITLSVQDAMKMIPLARRNKSSKAWIQTRYGGRSVAILLLLSAIVICCWLCLKALIEVKNNQLIE